MSCPIQRAVELALVMADALDDPEEAVSALVYLRGFFTCPLGYNLSGLNEKSAQSMRHLAKVVTDNLENSWVLKSSEKGIVARALDLRQAVQSLGWIDASR